MTALAEIMPAHVPQSQATVSFKKILLATDFSDASEKAFAYAIAMARQHGSKIFVVHVMPPETTALLPEFPSERLVHPGEREMKTLAERSELREVEHETMLRVGPLWDVLSSVIREQKIDLVVLGTHGRGGVKKLLLGSVAEEVIHRADCPVMSVGPHVQVPASPGFRRILFTSDFHPASTKALESALLLANQFQAKLILLHVMLPAALPGPGQTFYHEKQVRDWQERVTADTKQKLEQLLPASVKPWSEPECVASFDFAAEGILKLAEERGADLIVMGANRPLSAKISAHGFKSVSYEVMCHAKCAVLTVSG